MNLKDNLNKRYTTISIYVIITAVVIYILSLIAGNAPLILKVIMDKILWLLKVSQPIVIGFIFAYLLEPMITFFEMKYKKLKILRNRQKSCRAYAIFTSLALVVVVFVTLISLLVYSVTDQLKVFNLDDLITLSNEYINSLNDLYLSVINRLNSMDIQSAPIKDFIEEAFAFIIDFLRGIGNGFLTSLTNVSGYFTTFFFSIIIMIYLMIDGKKLKSIIAKISYALLNSRFNEGLKDCIRTLDHVFAGYIRGQLADAFVMMILISLTLSVIGIKFGLLIGILAGIGNLIPYCGPFIAYIGTILIALLNGQYKQMIIAIIALFIVQAIDANVIGPKLLSQSIQVHPLLVIISLIFGNAVGGLSGMILAVPIGVFIKVMFMRFIEYRLRMKALKEKIEKS